MRTAIKKAMEKEGDVEVAGWVHETRDLGGIKFIVLRDRSGKLQITAPKKKVSPEVFKAMDQSFETVLEIKGAMQASEKAVGGAELIPEQINVLSKAMTPLPLDPSWKVPAEFDTRLDNRFLDMRRPEVTSIFKIRNVLNRATRGYMESQGFIEFYPPLIVAAGAEGGAELFPISYFDKEAFLTQSAQLYKQYAVAAGMEKVYQIAPCWRAEESHTSRHLTEFFQIDVEMGFIKNEEDVMNICEGVFNASLQKINEECGEQLKNLGVHLVVPKTPYPRITYTKALELLDSDGRHIEWGEDIDREAEKQLGDIMMKKGDPAFFITKYPSIQKPFYIMKDGEFSRGFDMDYMGWEMSSGGQREHRYDVLEAEMKKGDMNLDAFKFYLDIFRYGCPPHGGFGLGVERILTKILKLHNIRESIMFPRDTKRLIP